MPQIQIFEPAMCCSTGVCGPSVDPVLVRFAADVEWLKGQGVEVVRSNLSQQPQEFASNSAVRSALQERGVEILPLIIAEGKVVREGSYPTRAELAAYVGLQEQVAPSIYSAAVAELVALGAAVAANCEPSFRAHYDRARKLGVSKEDMWLAVQTAQAVKDEPAKQMISLATRYLKPAAEELDELQVIQPNGCC
jgi:AhpD family alkylhydroperoxidase